MRRAVGSPHCRSKLCQSNRILPPPSPPHRRHPCQQWLACTKCGGPPTRGHCSARQGAGGHGMPKAAPAHAMLNAGWAAGMQWAATGGQPLLLRGDKHAAGLHSTMHDPAHTNQHTRIQSQCSAGTQQRPALLQQLQQLTGGVLSGVTRQHPGLAGQLSISCRESKVKQATLCW